MLKVEASEKVGLSIA